MVLTSISYLMFMHIWICMYLCYCSLQTNLEGRRAPSSLLVTSGFLLSYLLPGFWLHYSGSSMTSSLLNPVTTSSSLSHLAFCRHHLTYWEPLSSKPLPLTSCVSVLCSQMVVLNLSSTNTVLIGSSPVKKSHRVTSISGLMWDQGNSYCVKVAFLNPWYVHLCFVSIFLNILCDFCISCGSIGKQKPLKYFNLRDCSTGN